MLVAVVVFGCMALYLMTRPAGKAGFDWVKFLVALGVLALVPAVLVPMMLSETMNAHPALQVVFALVLIVVCVVGLTLWGLKRKGMREGGA